MRKQLGKIPPKEGFVVGLEVWATVSEDRDVGSSGSGSSPSWHGGERARCCRRFSSTVFQPFGVDTVFLPFYK